MKTLQRLALALLLVVCGDSAARAIDITVSSFSTSAVYQQTDTVVVLRLYYSDTFVDSNGLVIVGGALGSSNFYKSIACTLNVTTKIATCASFVIPSTMDSSKSTATLSGALYGGKTESSVAQRSVIFTGWHIPTVPTTTTYKDLNTYNTTKRPTNPDGSVAPDVASNPTAIGKNDPVVNVSINAKSYGALGDGSTNDTAAIQAALTAGAGGTVVLPQSSSFYKITASLTIPSNTTFRLERGATLRQVTTTIPAISLGTVSDVTIEGSGIIESTYVSGTGLVPGGFFGLIETGGGNVVTNLTIKDITVRNAYSILFFPGNNANVNTRLLHVNLTNCDAFAVGMAGTMTVDDCDISGAHYSGIDSAYSKARIVNSRIHDNGVGGPLDLDSMCGIFMLSASNVQAQDVVISNNTIWNNNAYGIMVVDGAGVAENGTGRFITITGNSVFGHTNNTSPTYISAHKPAGIQIISSTGVIVTNNNAHDNYNNIALSLVDTTAGLALPSLVMVQNNISYGAAHFGIGVESPLSTVTGLPMANIITAIVSGNFSINDATPYSFPATDLLFHEHNLVSPLTETLGSALVTNPGFETGTPPSNWTALGGAVLTRVGDPRPGSGGSFAMHAVIGSQLAVAVSDTFTLVQGHLYKVSGWGKNIAQTPAEVIVQNVGTGVYEFGSPLFASMGWTSRSGYFRALHSGTYRMILQSGSGTLAKARFDDVSVKEVTSAPHYFEDESAVALKPGATVTVNPTLGHFFTLTPDQATSIVADSVLKVGEVITIKVLASGASSYNLTLNTNFKSQGTLATGTASGKVFLLRFVSDGTQWVEASRTAAQ